MKSDTRKRVVVIGNGMTSQKFIEKMRELDKGQKFKITTFCEEPRAAYNRMRLTEYFSNRDLNDLSLCGQYQDNGKGTWFDENDVEIHVGDKAITIDKSAKIVESALGKRQAFDIAVLATGSVPFVPPTKGQDKPGVFVYRTIEDLESMIAYQKQHNIKKAAVIGGGLLGLEAAKALYDLNLEAHIVEYAPILMGRQIDSAGYKILKKKIEDIGIKIHTNARVSNFFGEDGVKGIELTIDGVPDILEVGMVIISAGIRPRDELARGVVDVHEKGGILVDNFLQTSDPNIYAIGECVVVGGNIFGLVAPCYQMAEVLATNLNSEIQGKSFSVDFLTAMSTKLKLLGCEVASFGDYMDNKAGVLSIISDDPFAQTYKKLVFSADGLYLKGGILVGDANEFGKLLGIVSSGKPLQCLPSELMNGGAVGAGKAGTSVLDMDDDFQVCSCNTITKGQILDAIKVQDLQTVASVKSCTKAGTGCGGCMPDVEKIFKYAMEKKGVQISKGLCEHFNFSRQELYDIVRIA